MDNAIPLTVFLSAVQSDVSTFHPQWWPMTKHFHHQPRNGKANLNTPLTAQIGESVGLHGTQQAHTSKYPKVSIMLFSLPLGYWEFSCKLSGCNTSFQMSSPVRWSNAQLTVIVGSPEWHTLLSSAWSFSEPEICEAQQLTLLLSTALRQYTLLTLSARRPFKL